MSIIARHRLYLCMSKIAADFRVGQGFKHLKKQKVVFQSLQSWVNIELANKVKVVASYPIIFAYLAIFLQMSMASGG